MNYKRIYESLMESRLLLKEERIKLKKMGEYFEAHHILPKSMGGLGDGRNFKHTNIVLLTGREHYIAHALLFLIHRNRTMSVAFMTMCNMKESGKRNYTVSARLYEELKVYINTMGVSDNTREKMRQNRLGKKHSSETRQKMRQSRLGKKQSPETKEKLRQSNLGKTISREHVEKLRQSRLGKSFSPEHVERLRQSKLGKSLSSETREKLRQVNLGKKPSSETREKMRQSRLGKKFSSEHVEKLRQSKLGKKQSPESVKKRVETIKRNRLLKLAQLNGDGVQGG